MSKTFYVNFYQNPLGTVVNDPPITKRYRFGTRAIAKSRSDNRATSYPERPLAYRIKVIPKQGFNFSMRRWVA